MALTDYPAHITPYFYRHLPFSQWRNYLEQLIGASALVNVRVRNANGCSHCSHNELDELKGWSGRVVCAEILDPNRFSGYLDQLNQPAGLQQFLHDAKWPDLRSSALMQCVLGVLDPFDVEAHFSLFDTPVWRYAQLEALYE